MLAQPHTYKYKMQRGIFEEGKNRSQPTILDIIGDKNAFILYEVTISTISRFYADRIADK